MATTIGFRPTVEDERILKEAAEPGETTTDTIRRALRLLEHNAWLTQFQREAEQIKDEDLSSEPDAW